MEDMADMEVTEMDLVEGEEDMVEMVATEEIWEEIQ